MRLLALGGYRLAAVDDYVPGGDVVMRAASNDQHAAELFIQAFDRAWSKNDIEAVMALFAEDATLESPLVVRLLSRKEGICRGRDDIRRLVAELVRRGMPWGKRNEPIVRGNTVVVEFNSADDGQPYSVDVIELTDGKIQSLRAYVGWRAAAAASVTVPSRD